MGVVAIIDAPLLMSRIFLGVVCGLVWGIASEPAWAQIKPPALTHVEPGLEEASTWKWSVESSSGSPWGLAVQVVETESAPRATPTPAAGSDGTYTVKKGDALILIAKKHAITVEQLKLANNLTSNLIHVGDVLRIPTAPEIAVMPVTKKPAVAGSAPGIPPGVDPQTLLLQIWLDRMNLSPGPITGKPDPQFDKLMYVFQMSRGGIMDLAPLLEAANTEVGPMVTTYTLRAADFRFIEPPGIPKAEKVSSKDPKAKPSAPPFTYEEYLERPTLVYRSPWEFVAERFHCDEGFLRALNPGIKGVPSAGTEFRVPNVKPFKIEDLPPSQPAPTEPGFVTANIVDLARLEIYHGDKLIASFPISSARPGLRGRGTWTILDAVPRPKLTTFREPREQPKAAASFYAGPSPTPDSTPLLEEKEVLGAGPNNPVGVVWINLAKTDDPTPLPFGLHGTNSPTRMGTHAGIGGFRLSNWDVSRAVSLLPPGTALIWKQSAPPQVAPARPAEAIEPADPAAPIATAPATTPVTEQAPTPTP